MITIFIYKNKTPIITKSKPQALTLLKSTKFQFFFCVEKESDEIIFSFFKKMSMHTI